MSAYRSQERFERPISTIVSNNSNFVQGKAGEPETAGEGDEERAQGKAHDVAQAEPRDLAVFDTRHTQRQVSRPEKDEAREAEVDRPCTESASALQLPERPGQQRQPGE